MVPGMDTNRRSWIAANRAVLACVAVTALLAAVLAETEGLIHAAVFVALAGGLCFAAKAACRAADRLAQSLETQQPPDK